MKSNITITMREWDSISDHDKGWSGLTEDGFLENQESTRRRLEQAAATMTRDKFWEWYEQVGFDLLERAGDLKVEWVAD